MSVTIFDLLLIALVLASAIAFARALILLATGKFRSATRTFFGLLAGLATYFTAICLVSLSATQKVRSLGEPDCSDDWCATPAKVSLEDQLISVEFRVWSRAKRITQREFGVNPLIVDDLGNKIAALIVSGPEFDRPIGPGEEFTTVRRYRVPARVATLNLVMRDGFGPETFVIGSSQSFLHPKTVYLLKPALGPV